MKSSYKRRERSVESRVQDAFAHLMHGNGFALDSAEFDEALELWGQAEALVRAEDASRAQGGD
jgi:hypothetical protein